MYHTYIFDAPKQVRDKSELSNLQVASEAAEKFMLTQFIITVLLNLTIQGTFTQLWNIFNTMQLIAALPTFMVKTPSNVARVHRDFSGVVNFEIVPKEMLYDWVVVPVLGMTGSE